MNNYSIVNLQERPALRRQAAEWFHRKWGIPAEEYLGSMDECLAGGSAVPQWYVVLQGNEIIGGAGIIANDFHERKDLTPNLCALYVEEAFRCQGITGRLLERACRDMKKSQFHYLYLVTEHTSFYERYGWEFLCLVQEEDGGMIRMYRRALA